MATYTHYEIANSPSTDWSDVFGASYVFNATVITFTNDDGTLTKARGSYVIINGGIVGGWVGSLERTSANGQIKYESITGLTQDVNQFLSWPEYSRMAHVMAGPDTVNGYSGDDRLFGGYGQNVMTGGAGDDTYLGTGDVVEQK